MKARIYAIIGAMALALGFGIGGATTASAQNIQNQYCTSGYCLNAWYGGPYVNAFTSGQVNNDFYAFKNADGYETIEFTGGGAYTFLCIADLGNNPNDARAGLSGNCSRGTIAWGANFQLINCGGAGSGTWAFKNNHWGGWLAPTGLANGDAFYLNDATRFCYSIAGAG